MATLFQGWLRGAQNSEKIKRIAWPGSILLNIKTGSSMFQSLELKELAGH
jgi:hypothetical protein